MEQFDKSRMFKHFILGEWDPNVKSIAEACKKCELSDLCDFIADETNNIDYCICLEGIEDKSYKDKHNKAYFVNFEDIKLI